MTLNPWDERYGSQDFYYGTEPNDFLRQQVSQLKPGARALCLAEGEGRNAVFLAQNGFAVTAVDGSRVGLEKLKRLAESKGVKVETVVSDLRDYVIGEDRWDGIVSVWCHLPRELRREVHACCVRGLRQGGVFLLEAYTPDQLRFKTGGPSSADLMPTLAELKTELHGLELVVGSEQERDVQEGKGHSGRSAVVQVVARRVV